ncbi:MAG: cysteine-rich small domain-containing protein [Firmicutes bacterium]|nr:cysteine-rich small domain-containing protein [Bacillota bacterium]
MEPLNFEITTENYKFHQHKECEFFPCHETKDVENFNCLFCYCPLYALGGKCGGNFKYMEGDIKDCSACLLPHRRKNYDYIMSKYGEILELAKQNK